MSKPIYGNTIGTPLNPQKIIEETVEHLRETGELAPEVDSVLSLTSINPIQNKAVKKAIDDISSKVTNVESQVKLTSSVILDDIQPRLNSLDEWREGLGDAVATNLCIVNAKDFGAIGDGKSHTVEKVYGSVELAKVDYPCAENLTDEIDGLAIQEALYEAEASGKPLYIPAGNYIVSKTITTHTRDTTVGASKQSVALNIFGSGMNTTFTTGSTFVGDYVFYIDVKQTNERSLWVHDFKIAISKNTEVSGIYFREIGMKSIIENLWIVNSYSGTPTKIQHGIYCKQATVTTFQRIKISAFKEGCGFTIASQHSTKIIDCDVTYCRWAMYLNGGSNNQVTSCRIDENRYGIYTNGAQGYRTDTFKNSAGISLPQFSGGHTNFGIIGNRFEGQMEYSVFIAPWPYSSGRLQYAYCTQITIARNDITALGLCGDKETGEKIFSKAIHLRQCKGVVIEQNCFKGSELNSSLPEYDEQNLYCADCVDVTIRDNVSIVLPIHPGMSGYVMSLDGSKRFRRPGYASNPCQLNTPYKFRVFHTQWLAPYKLEGITNLKATKYYLTEDLNGQVTENVNEAVSIYIEAVPSKSNSYYAYTIDTLSGDKKYIQLTFDKDGTRHRDAKDVDYVDASWVPSAEWEAMSSSEKSIFKFGSDGMFPDTFDAVEDIVVQSNYVLGTGLCTDFNFINDIEVNQSSRQTNNNDDAIEEALDRIISIQESLIGGTQQ